MQTNSKTAKKPPTTQAVNELIGYLGVMIDELQFKYCSGAITNPIDDKDAEDDYDGIPFDDDMPFV